MLGCMRRIYLPRCALIALVLAWLHPSDGMVSGLPPVCSPAQMKTKLAELGQGHLLEGLAAGQEESLMAQASELHAQLPGGLDGYVQSARKLLADSAAGVNPFTGFIPSVPHGEKLDAATPEFLQMEEVGSQQLAHSGFVLVAGGLGERLGYNGIKISLPLFECERKSFIQIYIEHILEMQDKSGAVRIPLAIMTSDDTHEMTVTLLRAHNNFGMAEGQITIMKQNKVPALRDSEARFSGGSGVIETKPHGHGDVHTLMHQTGLAKEWAASGVKWVVFFQDTNALIFRSLPAILGVSAMREFDINSVCVPRTPREAVGGICRLEHPDGRRYTVNVEYNQLDPLLRSTAAYASGDVADNTGFSPFPGNINILVFSASRYAAVLDETGGSISEFVNPKYADATRTTFKSPTRLECMMQDFPMLLPADANVGFSQLERWMCFSPVKNNLVDAAAKAKASLPAECAGTAERDAMSLNTRILSMSGVDIPLEATKGTFGGVPLTFSPIVVLHPSFGTCLTDVNKRIGADADVVVSARSALVLEGDVTIQGRLHLDGALVIKAVKGAQVFVHNLEISNAGWSIRESTQEEEEGDEMVRMRGYRVDKKDTRTYIFDQPGVYEIDEL